MDDGIPTDAFKPITGDDRSVVNAMRARNRKELKEWESGAVQGRLFQVTLYEPDGAVHHEYVTITDLAEEQPKVARERYAEYLTAEDYRRRKLEADSWTAAFFWPLTKETDWAPTHGEFIRLRAEGSEALPPAALDQIEALAEQYRFFHWHLEFPDVLQLPESSELSGSLAGGFDVKLGNPPWERIKLQEKEFFADTDNAQARAIANARTAAERRQLIRKLPQTNPALHTAYTTALRDSEATSHFLRDSGRFPLTSGGDINTYAVFTGLARQIIALDGRAGLVIPLGIAADYTYREFFADVMGKGELLSFYDFENREGIFPGVHRNYNFALTTLGGGEQSRSETEFAFFMTQFDHLQDSERRFPLASADLALMNPNTRTVPVFRTRRDAELTRRLYHAAPVLVNEQTGENPWGARFFTIFHMANDSQLFHTRGEMEAKGFVLEGNCFACGEDVYLPLYEAKMMHQFDHRHGTFEGQSETEIRKGLCRDVEEAKLISASFVPFPRYWTAEQSLVRALEEGSTRKWFIGFRNITRAVDRRTGTFAVLPWAPSGHSIQLIAAAIHEARLVPLLLSNLNSMVFDFLVRQKMGGINLSYYIVRQLPVFPPDCYTRDLLDFIVPRVVELTYTAWDLQPFAQDVLEEVGEETWARWFEDVPVHISPPPAWAPGTTPAPFVWDEERRACLRAELDGLYGHLYGLERDELAYILDTFPIVRRKDEERYGEYRTKRMVLEAYEGVESLTH